MNEQALVKHNGKMTIEEVKADVHLIQQVMQSVMKDGEHYGRIPGCGKKPTLLKPGAEKISSTFRLYPDVEILAEVDTPLEYTVKVKVSLKHGPSGVFCGSGVGACSSLEEKYGWRAAVCEEEYETTPEDRRRIKFKNSYGKTEKIQQIRTEPKTQMNTVIKMAKKRAYVDAVLSATAASDIFTQDLEDMPREPTPQPSKKGPPKSPPKVSEEERKRRGIKLIEELMTKVKSKYEIFEPEFIDARFNEWAYDFVPDPQPEKLETLDDLNIEQLLATYKELKEPDNRFEVFLQKHIEEGEAA